MQIANNAKILLSAGVVVVLVLIAVFVYVQFQPEIATETTSEKYEEVLSKPGEKIGAVVSSHELATNAGYQMLEIGGTAADAAVAVAAVLSVVEPWFSSVLGGGTWALYYSVHDDEVTSLDAVGPTGSNVTVADYRGRAGNAGIHQANTPGAWDGWMVWLYEYGRLDLGQVLAPAIAIARDGYTISDEMGSWLARDEAVIRRHPDTAAIYVRDGSIAQAGQTIQQHNMADTLEALVDAYSEKIEEGRGEAIAAARDYFYRGPIAEQIVAFSDANGGYLTIEDFDNVDAQIVTPISIDYKDGIRVFQNPPNSQGITMLLALNVLKQFDLRELGEGSDAIHVQAEAVKLAFADRHYHIGDPSRVSVPIDALLEDSYASSHRERVDMNSAMRWPLPDYLSEQIALDEDLANTTTFHVVDSHGNGAAVTTSLGAQFLVAGETGIHMNNRMRFLALEDGDPNQVTPGYKVRHTSNPYMAFKNNSLYILGGNTGADTQSQAQVQQFVNIVEFDMTAAEAIAAPRFISTAFPATTYPHSYTNLLRVESSMPSSLVTALRQKGHEVQVGGTGYGTANVIILSEDGEDADVAAEPRINVASGRTIKF
ncbi:MAG: gamma-glutamyltransferase family protein [Candidatus Paceibacteria bacterium]